MGDDQINAFRAFLDYGPIGLAGLTLILAVFAILARDIDELKYKLLNRVLMVGVVSLVALLVADFFSQDPVHEMRVSVAPFDNASEANDFPAPLTKVNEDKIDRTQPFLVSRDLVVSVDVSKAIKLLRESVDANKRQAESAAELQDQLSLLTEQIKKLSSEAAGVEALRATTALERSVSGINRTAKSISLEAPSSDVAE